MSRPMKHSEGKILARALMADAEHEQACMATEAGRSAQKLRERAHELDAAGRPDESRAMFVRAASLFSEADLGVAAASARFDLAECLRSQCRGDDVETLKQVRYLFASAERSPARRRDPRRHAMTMDRLAIAWRDSAPWDPGGKEHALETATRWHRAATRTLREIFPFGLRDLAVAVNSYAKTLLQMERFEEAHEECQGLRDELNRLADKKPELLRASNIDETISTIMTTQALALRLRGYEGDRARAVELLGDVIASESGIARQNAILLCSEIHFDSEEIARAREILSQIEVEALSTSNLFRVVELATSFADHDRALHACRVGRERARFQRRDSLASHHADREAYDLQRFSRLEANIHAARGADVEAFLSLENAAATRMHEEVGRHAWHLLSNRARELSRASAAVSGAAIALDEIGSAIARLPEPCRREELIELSTRIGESKDPVEELMATLVRDLVDSQRDTVSPEQNLYAAARALVDVVSAISKEAGEANVAAGGDSFPFVGFVDHDDLARCLDGAPNRVLVRVHLDPALPYVLAVSVFLEDGRVVARSASFACPSNFGTLLRIEHVEDAALSLSSRSMGASKIQWESVLGALDLRDVLPANEHAEIVILPSLAASRVPWAACGAPALIDRCASLSTLPSLTALLTRQAPSRARSGTLVVTPGTVGGPAETLFHDLAFATDAGSNECLRGADASAAALLGRSRSFDVVRFFGHGRHRAGEEPGMVLSDRVLKASEVGSDVFLGCERVELWACSSGLNEPTDPRSPRADEAFSLDGAFHYAGVRSTIGSLFPVPDFVAAHLANRFDVERAAGYSAPEALARAQRWWRRDALPKIEQMFRELPYCEAIERGGRMLGGDASGVELAAILGPVPVEERLSQSQLEARIAFLAAPESWAGFRFFGVHDRRPVHEIQPSDDVEDARRHALRVVKRHLRREGFFRESSGS